MKRVLVTLLLALSVGCGSLGTKTDFPAQLGNSGVGPFRELTLHETEVSQPPEGRALTGTGTSVERAMVVDGHMFYAYAPRLDMPPARDPALPYTEIDWAQFGARHVARGSSSNGIGFGAGADVLVPSEVWEGGHVFDPWVVVLPSGAARLYYAAQGGIGVAEASSVEGDFSRLGAAPVLVDDGAGVPRAPCVLADDDGGGFTMVFEAGTRLFLAHSEDGLVWTRVDLDPDDADIDPIELGLPPADGGVPGPDGSAPPMEIAQRSPAMVRVTTAAGRRVTRLYFEIERDDLSRAVGVAASLDGRIFERAVTPAFSKARTAPGAPAVLVRPDGTTLMWLRLTTVSAGVTAGYVAAAVAPGFISLVP